MAKKQAKPQVEEQDAPEPPPATSVEPPITGTCLICYYLQQGLQGPTCKNTRSPFWDQRMREEDSCEKFVAVRKP